MFTLINECNFFFLPRHIDDSGLHKYRILNRCNGKQQKKGCRSLKSKCIYFLESEIYEIQNLRSTGMNIFNANKLGVKGASSSNLKLGENI